MPIIEDHRRTHVGSTTTLGITRHWVTVDEIGQNPAIILRDGEIDGVKATGPGKSVPFGTRFPLTGGINNLFAFDARIDDQLEAMPKRYLLSVLYAPPSDTGVGGDQLRHVHGFSPHWRFSFRAANIPFRRLRGIVATETNADGGVDTIETPGSSTSVGNEENIGSTIFKPKKDQEEEADWFATVGLDFGTGAETTHLFDTLHNTSEGHDSSIPAMEVTATRLLITGSPSRFFSVRGLLNSTNSDDIFGAAPGHVRLVDYNIVNVDDLPGARVSGFSWRVSLTWIYAAIRLDRKGFGGVFVDDDRNEIIVANAVGGAFSKTFTVEGMTHMASQVVKTFD